MKKNSSSPCGRADRGRGRRRCGRAPRRARRSAARPRRAAPALVTLATAQRQDVPVTVQVNGSVVSLNSVDLRPQVTNTVREVHVKEGQFVKAGQLLFTLDDRPDQANLAKARAQQQRDEATLADLERQYKRSQELVAQNFIAKSAADATLSQLEAQRAAVAADRAAVQAAQVALGYATLRAPDRRAHRRHQHLPGHAGAAQPSLVTITQLDPIAVSFPVPEGKLQDLLAAARAQHAGRGPRAGPQDAAAGHAELRRQHGRPADRHGARQGRVRQRRPEPVARPVRRDPRHRAHHRRRHRGAGRGRCMMLAEGTLGLRGRCRPDAPRARKVQTLHTFGTQVAVRGVEPGEQVVIEGKQNVRPGGKVRARRRRRRRQRDGAEATPGSAASVAPGNASLVAERERT